MNIRIPVGTAFVPTGNFCFRQFIISDNTCTGMLSTPRFCENVVKTAFTYNCTRKLLKRIFEQ